MKKGLVDSLAVTASLGAFCLVAAAIGFLPAEQPSRVKREAFDVSMAREPSRPASLQGVEADEAPPAFSFALCRAGEGPRLYPLTLRPGHDALLVWCRGGYRLFEVAFEGNASVALTRVASFAAFGELPGGATAGDFDADGQIDLALATAPRPSVVHRSKTGVYWLRGRAQGGFEPARSLVESPAVALATLPRERPDADALVVLTRGDAVAQRPGQLWLFEHEKALVRTTTVSTLLAPRDLLLRPAKGGGVAAWVLSTTASTVMRVSLLPRADDDPPSSQKLTVRGPLGFVGGLADANAPLLVWAAQGVQRVIDEGEVEAKLEPQLEDASVGPTLRLDLDGDHTADLLSVVQSGIAWSAQGEGPLAELSLKRQVIDLSVVRDPAGQLRPVALSTGGEGEGEILTLLVLPPGPWESAASPRIQEGALREVASPSDVALQ